MKRHPELTELGESVYGPGTLVERRMDQTAWTWRITTPDGDILEFSDATVAGATQKVPLFSEVAPDTLVTVQRHPGDWRAAHVPAADLTDLHFRRAGGGVGKGHRYPMLYARLWCDRIPEGGDLSHSCRHGPPPHEILVVIQKNNTDQALYEALASVARQLPGRG